MYEKYVKGINPLISLEKGDLNSKIIMAEEHINILMVLIVISYGKPNFEKGESIKYHKGKCPSAFEKE